MDFHKIEEKWQKKWADAKIFKVSDSSKKKKFYCLEMFPYPSSYGLHMGHALNYTIGDIYARFKRMNGFNVLYPMGYDAFGLPAENAAIKAGEHPKKYTELSMNNFIKQQNALGLSYDWDRKVVTCYPEYYRWNQYFFLKFLENDLVHRKKSSVNWCPKCNTVLANEQVHAGKCWRHEDTDVEIKQLEQWFVRTTKYAEELLEDVKKLQWPERIKLMQENWIGKSYGTEILFEIAHDDFKDLEFVFFHAYKDNSKSVFWSWLKKEIESRGGRVAFAPDLPKPDEPIIEEWVNFVTEKYKFNKNTVIITHSLGGVLAMKLLPKLTGIRKLIMVAPPLKLEFLDGKKRPALERCCDWKFDFNEIKSKAKEIVVLADEKDHIVPMAHPKEIAESLSARLVVSVGEKTHFNNETETEVLNAVVDRWPIFTTRPDTIYGVTFMVVSAQHPRLMELVTKEQKKEVETFLKKIKSVSEKEQESLEKEGAFTGSYATNPLTKENVPVYTGNFVVADYGSGMVMAVPAHDQRDFEFAKKYKIPIKVVISPQDFELKADKMSRAYTDEGTLVNSDRFNGTNSREAIGEITKYLESKKLGRKVLQYKLRDWLISRQRYWGTPIPIVYCENCGAVPVPEKDLPVVLPDKVEFGEGNPLATNKEFVNVKCPKCNGKARRETDTMDTFFDSSWYFLRYCDSKNSKAPFEKQKIDYWMPVDQYIGGAEHACMHLIYARFFTKVLRDLGFLKFGEPFTKLFNQGMMHGPDGNKMSKSLGNVVNPIEMIDKYSADALRFNLMSLASPDKDSIWSEKNIESSIKFMFKLAHFFDVVKIGKSSKRIESKVNRTIKEVTEYIENFGYNIAIIKLRMLFETIEQEKEVSRQDVESFLKLLHPICPHITEEFWEKLGNKPFLSLESWPKHDEKKIDLTFDYIESMIANTRADIITVLELAKIQKPKKIALIVADAWKYTLFELVKNKIKETRNVGEITKAAMQTELKKYGQDIVKIVPKIIERMPEIVLSLETESKELEGKKEMFEKEFGCKVELVKAESSKEQKARSAMPGKPAILVS